MQASKNQILFATEVGGKLNAFIFVRIRNQTKGVDQTLYRSKLIMATL